MREGQAAEGSPRPHATRSGHNDKLTDPDRIDADIVVFLCPFPLFIVTRRSPDVALGRHVGVKAVKRIH